MSSPRFKVFVSSVQGEFVSDRKAVSAFMKNDALFNLYFDVFLFEELPAADRRADETYLNEVSQSAIYLGLFGNRYSSQDENIDPEDENFVSPTELEFNMATEASVYRLVFIKGRDDSKRHPKMKKLINKASSQLRRKRFNKTEDLLRERLYPSLIEFLKWKGILRSVSFEMETYPEIGISEINENRIRWFLKRAKQSRNYPLSTDTPVDEVMAHLNLINEDQLTQAAILLFGNNTQSYLPSSEVKCLHFHGTEAVKPIPDYQVYKGNIFELIDQATDYAMSKLSRRVGVRDQGPENEVTYDIPKAAVSEIIINALVHRDYESDASVQIYVFSDRLEVWNPGELPPTLTPAKLKHAHSSVPRNKRLCETLFLADYIDKAGTGILDVLNKCRDAGLPPPDFSQDGDQFRVILWRVWLTEAVMDELDLSDRQRKAVEYVKKHGKIANSDHQKLVGISRKSAARDLAQLVKCGVFKQVGERRGAHYVLAKENK